MESTISAGTFARYSLLTADEHYAMQGRAYRETVRSWAEARAATDLTLRGILTHSAIEADAFYQEVTLALSARTRPEMVRA